VTPVGRRDHRTHLAPSDDDRRHAALRRRVVVGGAVVALLGAEILLARSVLGKALVSVRHAQPGWIAVAVLAEATAMDLFARMRRRLLATAGLHVTVRETLAAVYVANSLHMTMPGGAAFSTTYVYRWMRDRGAAAAVGAWALVAGGVVSTSALAALAVCGSLFVGATAGLVALFLDVVLVVGLIAVIRTLRRRPELPLVAGRRLLHRVNTLLRRPPARGIDALERWTEQLATVRPSGRDWLAAAAYGSGNWLFDGACLAAAAAAVGTRGVSVPVLLIAYTAGMAVSGVSLLPGGVGVVDTAMVLAMVAGGVPAAAALPAVLLYRAIGLVAVVAAGWLLAALRSRGTSAPPSRAHGSRTARTE
jgi:putative heme transporter